MEPASAMDMQPAILLLGKTPNLLETLLGDLPGELLHWKPAPDRWSISEVLAHLAALEQVYAERALGMVAEDSPPLMKYDLAGQIAELYRAYAFHPHSGPFMKYSNPQP